MTKSVGMAVVLTVVGSSLAFGATNPWLGLVPSPEPNPFGAGGPDAYGYTWIDSDTVGGPTYNWIDITTVGDSVEGLGDDNTVGPFSIGFNFPYYWYQVDQFYVGSNGYLRFSSSGQWSQPFPGIPDPAEPNDVLAVLVADLLFGPTSPATAYTYTNGVDSLIVSFIDVPCWSTGGSHTFQVILDRADSTITYQYGPQTGAYSNDETLIGIENTTGTVGLEYLEDLQPPGNLPHDSLALLFTPPDSTTLQVHDVGVICVENQYSGGFFVHPGAPKTLWCKVKNVGNQSETDFDVTCEVRDPASALVYADTVTILTMAPGEIDSVSFSPDWFPAITGQYQVTATTHLAGDMNVNNNSILVECHCLLYPGELLYDDGLYESEWVWMWTPGQEAGLGSRFTPPSYPCRIDSASFYCSSGGIIPFYCRIHDDDGPGGYPGTLLAADTVTLPSTGWNTFDLTPFDLVINDGSFYAAWIQTGDENDSPTLGVDETPPISRQALEYTGVWAEFRNKSTADFMIRVRVNYGYGVDETLDPGCQTPDARLLQNHPNPFRQFTIINYQMPKGGYGTQDARHITLSIFDLSGRLIRTLIDDKPTAQDRQLRAVSWDGRDEAGQEAPSGIYFYRLQVGSYSAARKMVLLR